MLLYVVVCRPVAAVGAPVPRVGSLLFPIHGHSPSLSAVYYLFNLLPQGKKTSHGSGDFRLQKTLQDMKGTMTEIPGIPAGAGGSYMQAPGSEVEEVRI